MIEILYQWMHRKMVIYILKSQSWMDFGPGGWTIIYILLEKLWLSRKVHHIYDLIIKTILHKNMVTVVKGCSWFGFGWCWKLYLKREWYQSTIAFDPFPHLMSLLEGNFLNTMNSIFSLHFLSLNVQVIVHCNVFRIFNLNMP